MSDRKKKYISYKEANKRPVILSKHSEYNPDGDAKHKDTNRKDKSNSLIEKDSGNIASKQPTILIKTREDPQRSLSPKRSQNKENELGNVQKVVTTPVDNSTNLSSCKMKKPVKLIDNYMEFNTQALDYLIENQNDFLVVGVLGSQGVGKSTILNLIAHSNVHNLASRILNKVDNSTTTKESTDCLKTESSSDSKSSSEVYSECSDVQSSQSDKMSQHSTNANQNIDVLSKKTAELAIIDKTSLKNEANRNNCMKFDIETEDQLKFGLHCTDGVDMYITSNRIILLDTQPLLSISIMDKSIISSESKTMSHEVAVEMESLYFASFILATCHIVIVVQDWFLDSNVLRFLNTADMLRPQLNQPSNSQHPNSEENILEQFRAHILLVHNKAQASDFSHDTVKYYTSIYDTIFNASTKLKVRSGLGTNYDKKSDDYRSRKTGIEKKPDMNLFLLPEITCDNDDHMYMGHENLEYLVKRLRQNILGASRGQIAPSVTSEKHWGHNAHKTWEAIKKSGLFLEYCRMLH